MTRSPSSSLWYPRYVGDYQRKTAHLTLAEHGAYALLLDHYYATGKPLPANASRLQTICRAFAPQDVEAMHSVLREFFIETDDGYRNERADEELVKRCNISEKRKNAAHSRHANGGAKAPANAHTTTTTSTYRENRTRAKDDPVLVSAFHDLFWPHVPNKEAKLKSLRMFVPLAREIGVDAMVSYAKQWAARAAAESGGYTPNKSLYPTTWMNERRWESYAEMPAPMTEQEKAIAFARRAI